MDERVIRHTAQQEILHPTLKATQQLLAVNQVVTQDDIPYIEDIILDTQENLARVYFPVKGEEYFLVVSVPLEPQTSVSMVAMSPGSRVYFAIKSEESSLEDLLALTSIKPTKTWRKGERRGNSPQHSGFEVRPYEKETGEVEEKLDGLLAVLLPFQSELPTLSLKASIGIYIAYYGYQEQMWGLHLNEEAIRKLAALHVSVDIDLYASGANLNSSE